MVDTAARPIIQVRDLDNRFGDHVVHEHLDMDVYPGEIVGVVGDVAQRSLTRPVEPAMYWPLAQHSRMTLTLLARTTNNPVALAQSLQAVVSQLDPRLPLFQVRTLREQLLRSLALQRMAATMLSGFGILALLIAALGIHALLAHHVARRTREIGLRIALGSPLRRVLVSVLGRDLRLLAAGAVGGLVLAFIGTRALRSFLFGVQPDDPVSLATGIVVLLAAGAVACWFPARRATRVDPIVALRED